MFDPRRDISSISHRDVSPVSPFAVLSSSLADEILSRYGAMPDWYYPGSPMTFLEEKEEEDAGKRLPGKKAEPAEININLELFLAFSDPSLSPEEKEKILRIREIGAESVRVGERTILERAASLRREQFKRLTAPAIRQKRPAPYVPVTTVTSSLGKGDISRKKSPAMVFSEVIEKAQEAGVTFGGSRAGSVPVPVYISEFEKNNRPRDLWENPEAEQAETIETVISESAEPLEETVIREPEAGTVPESFLPGAEIIHKEEIENDAAGENPVSSVNTKTILGKLTGNLAALFQRDASNRKPSAQLQSEKARSAETAFETKERSDEKNHPETKQSESANASQKANGTGQKPVSMDRRKPVEEKTRETENAAQRSAAVPGAANKPVRTGLLKREAAEETAQTAATENIPTEKTFVERTNGETVLTGRTPEKNVSEEKISAEGVSGKAAFAENTAAGLPSEEKILLESEIAENSAAGRNSTDEIAASLLPGAEVTYRTESEAEAAAARENPSAPVDRIPAPSEKTSSEKVSPETALEEKILLESGIAENSAAIRNGANEGIASLLPGAEITYREETENDAAGEHPVSSVSAQSLLGKLTGNLTSLFQRDAASRKSSAQTGAASRTDAGSAAAADHLKEQNRPETKQSESVNAPQKASAGTFSEEKILQESKIVENPAARQKPVSMDRRKPAEEKIREAVNAAQRSAAVPGAADKPGRTDLLKREAAEETAETAATENIPTEKILVERSKEEPAERTITEKSLTGKSSEEEPVEAKTSEEGTFRKPASVENVSQELSSSEVVPAEKTPEEKILLESEMTENSAAGRNSTEEIAANLLPGAEITYRTEEANAAASGANPSVPAGQIPAPSEKTSSEKVSPETALEEKILLESEIAEHSAAIRNGADERNASLLPGAEITYREETEKEAAGEHPVSSVSAQSILGKLTGNLTSLFQRDAASRKPSAQAGAASRTDAGSAVAATQSGSQQHPENGRAEGRNTPVREAAKEQSSAERVFSEVPFVEKTSSGTVSEEKISAEGVSGEAAFAENTAAGLSSEEKILLESEIAESSAAIRNGADERSASLLPGAEITYREETEKEAAGEHPVSSVSAQSLLGKLTGSLTSLFQRDAASQKPSAQAGAASRTDAGSAAAADHLKEQNRPETKRQEPANVSQKANGTGASVKQVGREETVKPAHGTSLPTSNKTSAGTVSEEKLRESVNVGQKTGMILPEKKAEKETAAADNIPTEKTFVERTKEETVLTGRTPGKNVSEEKISAEEVSGGAASTEKTTAGTASEGPASEERILLESEMTENSAAGKNSTDEIAASLLPGAEITYRTEEANAAAAGENPSAPAGQIPAGEVIREVMKAVQKDGIGLSKKKDAEGPSYEGNTSTETSSEEKILLESAFTEETAGLNGADERITSLLPGAEITYREENSPADKLSGEPLPEEKTPGEKIHLESELAEIPAVGRNKADERITSLLPGAEITYRTGEEPGAVKATDAVPGAVQSTEKILGQLGREIASLSGKETGGVVPAQPQASISLLVGKLPAAVRNTAGMRYYRELSERRRPAGRVAPGTSYPSGAEGSFSEVTPGQEEPLYGEPLLWSGQEEARMEPGSLYGAVSISYADPVGNITREIQNAMQSGMFPGSGQRGFVNPGNLGDDFDPFAIAENAAEGRSFAEEIREELSTQGPPVTYQNPFFMGMGTDITYREKPARENPAAAKAPASQQSVHISDAEIRRSADRIYSMIKDKIKLERRSMGLS